MKRFAITALLAAVLLVPATALAHHGRRGHRVHRQHGQVGTIKSFDSSTGDLVITTNKGRDLSALVTDATHIECHAADTTTTTRHGDEGGGDDNQGDDPGDHDHGDHHGHQGQNGRCSTAALDAGTPVNRARIDLNGGDDAVWTKLVLG
jgi:hypothetical protein